MVLFHRTNFPMKQKKSQIQFPVFETNSQNPRYHSNWQMPTHIAHKHMRHRVTVVVSVSSYSRSVSKLPSKVHSANPSIPQSHRLRLSVISLKCLLLFLNGFFYYPIYYSHSGNLSTVFFKNVREAGEHFCEACKQKFYLARDRIKAETLEVQPLITPVQIHLKALP